MKALRGKRRFASVSMLLCAAVGAAGLTLAADEKAGSTTVIGAINPLLSQGAKALEAGNVEEGIRLTLEGLKVPSVRRDAAAGHSNLCAGYALLKQWDEALRHCNQALGLDSSNWRTYNNRAAVFGAKALFDLALRDLRTGLELAPNSRTLQESLRIVQENKRVHRERSRAAVNT